MEKDFHAVLGDAPTTPNAGLLSIEGPIVATSVGACGSGASSSRARVVAVRTGGYCNFPACLSVYNLRFRSPRRVC